MRTKADFPLYRGPMLALALLAVTGCAARYRTVHKVLGVEEEIPKQDDGKVVDVLPMPQAPTAAVEVIVNGTPVTKVTAGEDFVIRPTADSRDPDNGTPDSCANPGLIKAEYKVTDGAIKVATRASAAPCTSLEVQHQIATPGTYQVTLVVTSDEGETANATMTLVVTPQADPALPGGFVVTADPLVAYPGDTITFHGDCADAKKITWAFADGVSGEGAHPQHAFAKAGAYEVKATCERADGSSLDGSTSITILPKNPDSPPSSDDDPPTGDDGQGAGDDADAVPGGGDTDGQGDGSSTDHQGDDDGGSDGQDGDDELPPGSDHPGQSPHQGPTQTPVQKRL